MHLLEKVEMTAQAHKLPSAISGGQQQWVAIARALANDPPLLVADEPTGNLDPETSDGIIRLLMDISRNAGTAVLVASHDFLVIRKYPARTLQCEHGKISPFEVAASTQSTS